MGLAHISVLLRPSRSLLRSHSSRHQPCEHSFLLKGNPFFSIISSVCLHRSLAPRCLNATHKITPSRLSLARKSTPSISRTPIIINSTSTPKMKRSSITPSIPTDGREYGKITITIFGSMHVLTSYYHREWIHEPAAEFLGVFILIIFGNGVDCQVTLSGANTAVASSGKGVSLLLDIPVSWLSECPINRIIYLSTSHGPSVSSSQCLILGSTQLTFNVNQAQHSVFGCLVVCLEDTSTRLLLSLSPPSVTSHGAKYRSISSLNSWEVFVVLAASMPIISTPSILSKVDVTSEH